MSDNLDPLFFQLVLSLQAGAMQQMGKIASPFTGKVERDLDAAKMSIDMLGMFQAKMKGNLSGEESRLLDHVLYELRMNYVDESKKGDDKSDSADESAVSGSEGTGNAEPSPNTEKEN